jgi:y4mF family transcriptional regulator
VTDSRAIGVAIRAARERRGMTQVELALVAGVGQRFVVELEGGKETAQMGKMIHVLRCVGLTLMVMEEIAC